MWDTLRQSRQTDLPFGIHRPGLGARLHRLALSQWLALVSETTSLGRPLTALLQQVRSYHGTRRVPASKSGVCKFLLLEEKNTPPSGVPIVNL